MGGGGCSIGGGVLLTGGGLLPAGGGLLGGGIIEGGGNAKSSATRIVSRSNRSGVDSLSVRFLITPGTISGVPWDTKVTPDLFCKEPGPRKPSPENLVVNGSAFTRALAKT